MENVKIIVVNRGGTIQSVHCSLIRNIEVEVLDYDEPDVPEEAKRIARLEKEIKTMAKVY